MTNLYAMSGVGRAGKDSFADLFTEYLKPPVCRYAFANMLKKEIDPFLIERHGISAWTTNSADKAIIRPDLVAWGKMRRKESNGRHWIDQIQESVIKSLSHEMNVIITDCRFNTHDEDEAGWIHSLGGKIIYVERVLEDGSVVGPSNSEEAENDPKVRAAADIVVTIPTFSDNYLDKMRPHVLDVWIQLNS